MLTPFSLFQCIMFIVVGIISFIMFVTKTSHYHLLLISIASFLLSYTIYKEDKK